MTYLLGNGATLAGAILIWRGVFGTLVGEAGHLVSTNFHCEAAYLQMNQLASCTFGGRGTHSHGGITGKQYSVNALSVLYHNTDGARVLQRQEGNRKRLGQHGSLGADLSGLGLYVNGLNHALMNENGAEIRPDLENIPAMVAFRQQMTEMASKATMLTLNEQRALLGYQENFRQGAVAPTLRRSRPSREACPLL